MSSQRAYYAALMSAIGQQFARDSALDYSTTLALWSVLDTKPDQSTGAWVSSFGGRVLEVVPGQEQYRSYYEETLSSGKPAIRYPFGPRLRLRDGLDLSQTQSFAYILVFEAAAGNTQIILENTAQYDSNFPSFITYLENEIRPTYHGRSGGYADANLPFTPRVPYVLGYRMQGTMGGQSITSQTQYNTLTTRNDTGVTGAALDNRAFYVGARNGDGYPFRGWLSAIHIFKVRPTETEFNKWVNYYQKLYDPFTPRLLNDYNMATGVLTDGSGKVTGVLDTGYARKNLVFKQGTAPLAIAADDGNGYPCLETAEDTLLTADYGGYPYCANSNRDYTLILVCRFLGIRQQYQYPMGINNNGAFMYLSYGSTRSHWGLGYGGAGNLNTNGWLAAYALSGVDGNGNGVRSNNLWYQTDQGQVQNLDSFGDGGASPLQLLHIGQAWMRVMRVQVYNYHMSAEDLADKIDVLKSQYSKMPL